MRAADLGCTDGPPYEIIIATMAAAPDRALLRTPGQNVRLLRLGANQFVGEGLAASAKGQYLCFLNNNAFVQQRSLLWTLSTYTPAVGAVGPCLLFRTTPSKAGAAIDEAGYPVRSASGMVRITELLVQNTSTMPAATLLLPRNPVHDGGGFDLAYEPGSYEDADLCLKIHAVGRKVHCPEASFSLRHLRPMMTPSPHRRKALDDLNRGKFACVGAGFESRSDADLGA